MAQPEDKREGVEQEVQPGYTIMPADAPYESGFNIKTLWAALFVGFVMLPGAIYLGLVTGQSMAGASEWVTIILFLEIAKRSFVKLKTQEIIILFWIASGLIAMGGKLGTAANLFGGPFGQFIWYQYFVQSPEATGLAEHIPDWIVPPIGSEALLNRSFLHAAWLKPVGVLVAVMILTRINGIALGYVLFRMTNDVERLPFPLEPVAAGGATALAETSAKTEGWRWRVFSIGTIIGVVWGLLYVVIPTLSSTFLVTTVQILEIPFIDFTVGVKAILPATPLGLGTDLFHLLTGFVLPFWIVVGSFAAALTTVITNPLLYHFGILHSWAPGMSTIPTTISNSLDFWLSFSIGTSVTIAITGLVISLRAIQRSTRERRLAEQQGMGKPTGLGETPVGRGDIKIATALLFWAVSTAGFVGLVYILVPAFPWWISTIFGFLWTPFFSYIGARMIGLTGSPYGADFPYVREATFYMSGFQGAAIWFAPIPMFNHGVQVKAFKQLELTKTAFGSYIRMVALTFAIMLVCSFIFWSFIWKLSPIPSSAYPYVQKMWPLHATMQAMWAKSTLPGAKNWIIDVINWRYILAGLGIASTLFGLLHLLKLPSLIFYGFVGGLGQFPHFIFLTFIGALLGRFYFRPRFGLTKWSAYTPIVLAGYGCGMGLIGMTSIAIALISKAISQIVY